jgi:hypothetical protein
MYGIDKQKREDLFIIHIGQPKKKLTVTNEKDRDRFVDNEINNLIESLNNLGIGFTIKVGDVLKEYHFKIKIQKITMFLKDTSDIDYFSFT